MEKHIRLPMFCGKMGLPSVALLLLLGLTLPAAAQLEGPGCEPGSRILCTPNQATITATGNAAFHVILPANKRRAVTFPNTSTALVQVINRRGVICWDPALPCVGSYGSGTGPHPRHSLSTR